MKDYSIIHNEDDLTMFMTDTMERKLITFLHFKKVESTFRYLSLISVEKNGFEFSRSTFNIQKKSFVHKWSDVMSILSILDDYENVYIVHVNREIHELDLCEELIDCPTIQFIQE